MAEHYVDINVSIPLDRPVKVERSTSNREDVAKTVEWSVSISTQGRVHLRGRALGNWNVVANFSRDTRPDWAPKCPASLIAYAQDLLAEVKAQ